ncbi:Glutamate 5-kinase [Andreprevotia sp. IGB-42]|uniref:glutamate 5-kinase n=1 Tax=Andreprevotia sp. IGB-42 TaxID=2497473 RepID=UPI00135B4E6F|nr:glutamate 5-kinase [Andreprevotia sp. IGB-42]KAF0812397.1 Glutamate 5-kinase [Andreprevotia sp. IGB-42]
MPVSLIQSAHRLVVKVGSSLVTNEGRGLDHAALARWAAEIAELRRLGKDVVLVSSGAVAEGVARLGWTEKPASIHEKQAAAAVGQMGLCQAYESAFRQHGLKTAQVLLTHEDMADRTRYLNARSTLLTLLSLGVVPIINENDTVVTAEIKFGDNDTLGALVTNLIEGDALIILTDQQGLFTADPRSDPTATLIKEAVAGTQELEAMAGGAGSSVGTGGMFTKVIAAKRAARSGAATVIASGREANVLTRLASGEAIGTQLIAQTTPLAAKKQWIADHLQIRGRLVLDAGAVHALREKGSSLLPIGVVTAEGEFQRGDVVRCIGPDHIEIARGIVNYSSQDARKIARLPTGQIEAALGYIDEPELIHRDNLVVV